jgi:hypothetical protein
MTYTQLINYLLVMLAVGQFTGLSIALLFYWARF